VDHTRLAEHHADRQRINGTHSMYLIVANDHPMVSRLTDHRVGTDDDALTIGYHQIVIHQSRHCRCKIVYPTTLRHRLKR